MRSIVTLLFAALVAAAPHARPQQEDMSALPVDPVPLPTTSLITADPTLPITESTSLNVPTTIPTLLPTLSVPRNLSSSANSTKTSKHHFSHWEPIPIFTKSCDCPNIATVPYPCWAYDSLQRCNFEELHSFICWTSAGGGCPTPTRKCGALFTSTPLTGKHPCELGQNTGGLETPTVTLIPTITAVPTLTEIPTITEIPTVTVGTSVTVPSLARR